MAETEKRPRVVVITGASAGVGRATVRRFAAEGAKIGLIARGKARLEAAAREVEEAGGEALVLSYDVACPVSMEEAAQRVEERFGPIDIWINNTSVTVYAPFEMLTPEEFKRVTEVTYLGTVYGTMAALKRMKPRDQGIILQVGSALAYRAIPLQSAYCGSKHAIQGFSESIRSELIHDKSNVHIAMIQLPALNTPQFEWCRSKMPEKAQPVPPIYDPAVAAEALHWAADNAPRELNVGGNTSVILALNNFFPGIGDLYLGVAGYTGQTTGEPEDPNRPDNLFEPVEGDWAADGRFGDRVRTHSKGLWVATHKGAVAAAGVLVAGLAYYALQQRKEKGTATPALEGATIESPPALESVTSENRPAPESATVEPPAADSGATTAAAEPESMP